MDLRMNMKMDLIEDKFIRSSKERFCGVCNTSIPKDTIHVFQTWVDEETETYCVMRVCRVCDYLHYVDRINDAWPSDSGAPVDLDEKATLFTTRFNSKAIQNYLSQGSSKVSEEWYCEELQRRLVSRTSNN